MGLAVIVASIVVPFLAALPIKIYVATYPNATGGLGFGLLLVAGVGVGIILFIIGCILLLTTLKK